MFYVHIKKEVKEPKRIINNKHKAIKLYYLYLLKSALISATFRVPLLLVSDSVLALYCHLRNKIT